ncbi:carbon starvation CstA family protein [Oceanivirga salmonicida]|uniref:carbon starvation CstA family protein n=1 Tax=Oceanivirga salmonicida TaxID=1769291 RepID=UPI0012E1F111|nr:carbon starvation CstA family protein [Oceanivirga salmonicida]
MYTFIFSLVLLIIGYLTYGKYVEKVFGADPSRPTPAISQPDGVDFVPLGSFRALFIQFLNVVGTGPIFGAIAGALFGPMAFVWIVLGCVFGGAVHDFFSGMLSVRSKGATIGELVGENLGEFARHGMRLFSVVLLVLTGVVFLTSPADILFNLTGGAISRNMLLIIIISYYIFATLLPVDKLIAKIYPLFGMALFFMAVGISVSLIVGNIKGIYYTPEITHLATKINWNTTHTLFPFLFISIACGAISGFHATQSPIIGRCIKSEKDGRKVFYLAMIGEGIVATVWAAAAMTLFPLAGEGLGLASQLEGLRAAGSAPVVVNSVASLTLGKLGAGLAVLGVVAAPITSGDTSFRGARLIIADVFKISQQPIRNRLFIAIPLFAVGAILSQVDFNIIWRYFAWSNQTLATIGLWSSTAWLLKRNKNYLITLLPALFMTMVTVTYIVIAPEGFVRFFRDAGQDTILMGGLLIASIVAISALVKFIMTKREYDKNNLYIED